MNIFRDRFTKDTFLILELKITQLNEKLTSAKKDYLSETERTLMLKNTLKKIKIDLHNMSANLQDPNKLKMNVKVRYCNCIYFKFSINVDDLHDPTVYSKDGQTFSLGTRKRNKFHRVPN